MSKDTVTNPRSNGAGAVTPEKIADLAGELSADEIKALVELLRGLAREKAKAEAAAAKAEAGPPVRGENSEPWIEERYHKIRGRLYGPYYRRCWWEGGRRKSKYLGKSLGAASLC